MAVRPFLARILTAGVTGAVALAAVAMTVGAAQSIARGAAEVAPPPPAPLTPVRTVPVVLESGFPVDRFFVGQFEPARETPLGFEFAGRIAAVLVEEGARVRQGDVLARIDTAFLIPERAGLVAERAALMAEAELARLTTGRNAELKARGHRSQAALDDARLALAGIEARIDALSAGIDGVDVRIAKSEIHAPFDGEVGARNADPGRTVAAGEPVLTLLETGAPRLRVGLPAESASALTPGDAVEVLAGGVAWRARVERVRPDLEAVTRTRAVIVALDRAGAGAPAFGDTGTLVLRTRVEEPGFWAPLAALSEGARGAWTVMALDGAGPDARAVPAPVEVIHAEADRVYVRGALPAGARIIAAGPERIVAGQSVLALAE